MKPVLGESYQEAAYIPKRCTELGYHKIGGRRAPGSYNMLKVCVRLEGKRGNQSTHHKKKNMARIHVHWVNNTEKPHWGPQLLCSAEHNAPPRPCWDSRHSTTTPQRPEGASQSLSLLLPAQNQQSGKVLWLSRVYLLNKGCDGKSNGTGERALRKWFPGRKETAGIWGQDWDGDQAPVSKDLSPMPNPLLKWNPTISPSQPVSPPRSSQSIHRLWKGQPLQKKLIQNSSWVPDCPDDRDWGANKREKHWKNEKREDFFLRC